jgi:hypothetical protein
MRCRVFAASFLRWESQDDQWCSSYDVSARFGKIRLCSVDMETSSLVHNYFSLSLYRLQYYIKSDLSLSHSYSQTAKQ